MKRETVETAKVLFNLFNPVLKRLENKPRAQMSQTELKLLRRLRSTKR